MSHTITDEQIAEAVAKLDRLGGDQESDHAQADDIAASLLPPEVVEATRRAEVRDDGWWWA